MERAEKAKSPEMETAGLPPNDMKRFYVNGRHLLREIAGLYVLIPAGETDRVFERFYRVDKSHSKASGGTGLGLSIVKHAAAYHHGTVQLESQPGKGTTITVTIPRKQS